MATAYIITHQQLIKQATTQSLCKPYIEESRHERFDMQNVYKLMLTPHVAIPFFGSAGRSFIFVTGEQQYPSVISILPVLAKPLRSKVVGPATPPQYLRH